MADATTPEEDQCVDILEGKLPPQNKEWYVLYARSPAAPLGASWDLALLLAETGQGGLVQAVVVDDMSPTTLELARVSLHEAEASYHGRTKIYSFVVTAAEYHREVDDFILDYSIDVLVDDVSDTISHDLDKVSCAAIGLRGDTAALQEGTSGIRRILVPTSGGPNTVYALSMLLPLTPEVEVTALYVAPEHMGENEVALGRDRLRKTIDYIDGGEKIKSELVTAPTISQGIREAAKAYDLVLIGASLESSVDKVLFGNIPDQIVRLSKTPVAVLREPRNSVSRFFSDIAWRLQNVIPRLNLSERTETYVRIRRGARPSVDFYVLISLSALIAALGLISNSAAVVIGAMLVAPLMSPIVGTGMAIVLGDVRFLRLAVGAVARGALLAVLLSIPIGLLRVGDPLTAELMGRTQPSLVDLFIALFSGMAAAYALSKSNAAAALPGVAIAAALVPPLATVGVTLSAGYYMESLGALLLFITNFVAITVATAVVFLILGFRPATAQKHRKEVRARSGTIALISLGVITALLLVSTVLLNQQRADSARIREVVEQQLQQVAGAQLMEMTIASFDGGHLELDIVARSTRPIRHQTVQELQEAIGGQLVADGIIDSIALTLTVIEVTELDPLQPPTPTPGPSPTPEPTPVEEVRHASLLIS
jgi:uncharacterized hydrophobic protein (TIGR00271 family)